MCEAKYTTPTAKLAAKRCVGNLFAAVGGTDKRASGNDGSQWMQAPGPLRTGAFQVLSSSANTSTRIIDNNFWQ
jgi:hypothetical protein